MRHHVWPQWYCYHTIWKPKVSPKLPVQCWGDRWGSRLWVFEELLSGSLNSYCWLKKIGSDVEVSSGGRGELKNGVWVKKQQCSIISKSLLHTLWSQDGSFFQHGSTLKHDHVLVSLMHSCTLGGMEPQLYIHYTGQTRAAPQLVYASFRRAST